MLNKIFHIAALVSLALLSFVLGALFLNYNIPPATVIKEAIYGGEALIEQYNEQYDIGTDGAYGKTVDTKNTNTGDRAFEGYTLISGRYSSTVYLIGMDGTVQHRWHMPFNKVWPNPTHVNKNAKVKTSIETAYAFPDGSLLIQFIGRGDTPYGYGLAKIDAHSKLLWAYGQNAHHDLYVDKASGEIYTLTQEMIHSAPKGFESLSFPMLVDYIVKLSADGRELDKLSLLEAFKFYDISVISNYHYPYKPWDPLHTNSIVKLEPGMASSYPMFTPGQLLISLRNMGMLAVVDLEKRVVTWAKTGTWKMQHSAKFIENGNILLFDNHWHTHRQKKYSRIIEIDPKSLQAVWYYGGEGKDGFYTSGVGRVQKLPNNNYLVVETKNKRVFEVTADKRIVWDYVLPRHMKINEVTTGVRYAPEELPFLTRLQ